LKSISVRIASVTGFLPSTEDMSAPFLGTTPGRPGTGPTPVQTTTQHHDAQISDAADRNVVWDAEDGLANCGDVDAEGEDDPSYVRAFDDSGVEFFVPIGIRNGDGQIEPMPIEVEVEKETLVFEGVEERAPGHVGDLVRATLVVC
jgi:meiosis-specific protein HOP1